MAEKDTKKQIPPEVLSLARGFVIDGFSYVQFLGETGKAEYYHIAFRQHVCVGLPKVYALDKISRCTKLLDENKASEVLNLFCKEN